MDAAGIAERTRPPATAEANGRAPEPRYFIDPTMTRAARAERAVRRRAAPEAWQRELQDLYHYTSEYPYDPDHEYAWDWTTDPNYGTDSVRLFRFDANGVMDVPDKRARVIQLTAFDTTDDKLGSCVESETALHYRAADGVVRRVHPDLMVLPQAGMLGMATGRARALRLDRGDPPPALALEILSFGGMQRDLEDKLRLYEDLGIREYLVYDLGGKRRSRSPRELLLFRLEDGVYRQIEPEPKENDADPDEHWSDVFGTYIRMMPDPREGFSEKPEEYQPTPRFQWWDPERNRWRDRETDAEVEQDRVVRERDQAAQERDRVAQERDRVTQERDQAAQERDRAAQERDRAAQERDQAVQEQTNMAVAMLRSLLSRELASTDLNRVEEAWHRYGSPSDVVNRILKVQETPIEWQALLLPGENDDKGSDHTPPSRATGSR